MTSTRQILFPYALIGLALSIGTQVALAIRGSRIDALAGLLTGASALFYAWWLITRGRALRKIRFGQFTIHAITFAIVCVPYLLHGFVLALLGSPALDGNQHLALQPGWFGVLVSMPALWGVGLIIHGVASVGMGGFEETV